MSQRSVCYYHNDCFDGTAAAMVVKTAVKDVVLIPADYGNVPNVDDVMDAVVYVVDFSFSDEVFELLLTLAEKVIVMDHHKSAKPILERAAELAKVLSPESQFLYNVECSGALIAWSYFYPDRFTPPLILHVSDRDLWAFTREDTREVMAGLSVLKNEPETWYAAIGLDSAGSVRDIEHRMETYRQHCLSIGQCILTRDATIIDALLKNNVRTMQKQVPNPTIGEPYIVLNCGVVNIPRQFTSEAMSTLLASRPDLDFAVGYYRDGEGIFRYSLRSRSGSDVDVSDICKIYGGGGHKHAAGFKYDPREDPYGESEPLFSER